MKTNLSIKLFIAAVFVLPLSLYALISFYENKIQSLPVLGKSVEINGKEIQHRIADFTFTDQDGNTYSNKDWGNKIVVADFFFTRCPTICPKMTNSLKEVRNAYINDPDILINSFTVDPGNDDATVLKTYAKKSGINSADWKLLTGDKKEIYKLARNSFFVTTTDGDGGPGDFIHSEKLILIDQQRRIRGYYSGTDSNEVSQLIQDIKKLKNEN